MATQTEQILDQISNRLYSIQKIVLLFLVATITLINSAQIIGRYVFHFSLPWSEQLSVLLFIIIIMFGASLAVRTDSEIKIAFLKCKSVQAQQSLALLADLISLVAILFFLCSSVSYFQHSLKFTQVVSSLQISYSYAFFFLPVGFALVAVEKLFHIIRKIIFLTSYTK